MLNNKILPDENILQRIVDTTNRSSNVLQTLFRKLCAYIKELSPEITHVCPAYRLKSNEKDNLQVVFVVHTTRVIEMKCKYITYQRCEDDILDISRLENEAIYEYEQAHCYEMYQADEMESVRTFVKENAKKLMEMHSNLTEVSTSCVKSSGFQSDSHCMKNIPCVALHVQVKGLIPFQEDMFNETVRGIPFDVREGVFTLSGKPDEFHQNVKMGCEIDSGYGTSQGTLGPFFQLKNHQQTYFLTSAHVVLDTKQMELLKECQDGCMHYGMCGNNIFQPPESKSVKDENKRYPVGKIKLAVYKEGNETEAGMELAVVQINKDRLPNTDLFLDDTHRLGIALKIKNYL